MQRVPREAAISKVQAYLRRGLTRPYFVVAEDGEDFLAVKNSLSGLEQIRASDFCGDDFFLNLDFLLNALENLSNDAVCIGVSEVDFLSGDRRILNALYSRLFRRHIVILCRSSAAAIKNFASVDVKFRRYCCLVESQNNFSVIRYAAALNVAVDAENFAGLLKLLENGKNGVVTVNTNLPLKNVRTIETFCAAFKFKNPTFSVPDKALTPEQWRRILQGEAPSTFLKYWHSFFEGALGSFASDYLKYAFAQSSTYDEYEAAIFFALLQLNPRDENFSEYYLDRKNLVKNYDSENLSRYLAAAEKLGVDAVHFLTDNTSEEMTAMIRAIRGAKEIPAALLKNCRALAWYLSAYDFGDERLNKYFKRYRELKLTDTVEENFLREVENLARRRIYFKFETRQYELDKLDKTATLYWLDALGVEYLGYIQNFASALKLSTKIKIARAELPTTTEINKNFYDNWQSAKIKNQRLDNLIHTPKKSIAEIVIEELQVIGAALKEICSKLIRGHAKKIILTSDHGASRLAVKRHGRIWKSTTKGERGGRYCLAPDSGSKPNFAAEENHCWVMANYDRFEGGKIVGAEVHGGATLEEVLIPVVEIELR